MYEIIKTFPYWLQLAVVLIPAVSLFIGVIAFVINVRQTILNNTLVRAKIVSDSLHTFMDDETIQKAFYDVEYGRFKYHSNFHGSDEEKEIDKLLRHFSNLAIMWKNDILKIQDIHPIQYFILRTMENSEIQNYLKFIDSWSKDAGTGGHPYVALTDLANEIKT